MIEVKYVETPFGKEPVCKKCGLDVVWHECEHCEDANSSHDCGEDVCCCLDPQPNVLCDVCNGEGGWWVCDNCKEVLKE